MKYELCKKAKELRKNGVAITKIAKELCVAKSTVSLWVRNVFLSDRQKLSLQKDKISFLIINIYFVNYNEEKNN